MCNCSMICVVSEVDATPLSLECEGVPEFGNYNVLFPIKISLLSKFSIYFHNIAWCTIYHFK